MNSDYVYEISISGVYPSEACYESEHIWSGCHDDDTGVFTFLMDCAMRDEKDGMVRYTFPDGVVFIQHDGVMETESEFEKGKL